ncbi:hypothetical protein ACYOEI_40365, partial [Singulisphaera rosea]
DAGLAALGRIPSLSSIDLSGTQVTDAGLAALGTRTYFLTLKGTPVTEAGILAFKKTRPQSFIEH